MLHSLMNVRPPRPVSDEFLKIQDEYLTERNKERGIIDVATLKNVPANKRIFLWQGDITTLNADAIVNAANSALLGCFAPLHACIDNCIHTFAGVQLRLECNEIMQKQGSPEKNWKRENHSGVQSALKIRSAHGRSDNPHQCNRTR